MTDLERKKVRDLTNIGDIQAGDVLVAERTPGTTVLVNYTTSGGSGITDGDKGDITVASSGTVWTIDTPTVATVATDDKILIKDTSNSDATAYVTAQSIADLASGTVSSVNGETGAVTLTSDDISDTTQAHKFVTSSDLTKLSNLSGTNTGDQTITLTGDVTGSGTGSFAATIADDAVTYAKMQNVSATDKLLGRSSALAGDVEEITCTAAGRALLDDTDAAAQRTTLGLGTLATQSGTFSGTSSGTNTGDQNLFSTIAVSGQSDVIADSTTDTLTLAAGTAMTLTTNATTDTVTITNAGVTSLTGTSDQITASAATGAVTLSIPANPIFTGVTSTTISAGSTGNRPAASGTAGRLRVNTSTADFEWNDSSTWHAPLYFNTGYSSTANAIPKFTSNNSAAISNTSVLIDSNSNISGQNNILDAYATTATAAGTTTLTVSSKNTQFFTGTTTQTVALPVTSTLSLGHVFRIVNNSTGVVTVQSSGANTVVAMASLTELVVTCILTSGTTAASWDYTYTTNGSGITGSGSLVRATSPTLVTPVLGTPSSGTLTNCTDYRGGTQQSFKATKAAAQTLGAATHTKVTLTAETWDTSGTFDSATNYRHTPTVAGKYMYLGNVLFVSPTDQNQLITEIYKNGSLDTQNSNNASGSASCYVNVPTIIDMNGTTDYVELYAYRTSGGDISNASLVGIFLGT